MMDTRQPRYACGTPSAQNAMIKIKSDHSRPRLPQAPEVEAHWALALLIAANRQQAIDVKLIRRSRDAITEFQRLLSEDDRGNIVRR